MGNPKTMKIGVLGVFYGCADLLPKVMEPWIALKNEGADIVFGAINTQFKEYAELGYPNDDDATRAMLEENRALFDPLLIAKKPMFEKDARTLLLQELVKQNLDLVWLLDGDEVYTKEQLQNTIEFIKKTNFDYYHIYFNNHIFDTIKWRDNFAPPRVFRTNRHGGVHEFTWDNELVFSNGTRAQECIPGMVPKQLAHVLHHTWRKGDAEKKIAYHQKHFGYSMYRLNASHELDVDPAYFERFGLPVPTREPNGSFALSPKPEFEVILRTHATGNFREGMRRAIDFAGGKAELTLRVLWSIIRSLLVLERENLATIKLTILDDHSDEQSIEHMRSLLEMCPFKTELIGLKEPGNPYSLQQCYERGRRSQADWIYFVEDDYLHEPTALLEMVEAYTLFSKKLSQPNVGLHPLDERDRYDKEQIAQSRVVMGTRRHWRTVGRTTSTFFLPRATVEKYWEHIIRNITNGMIEDGSINTVWQEYVPMFSPIPTLAYHMHGEDRMPPFSNWKKLWNSLAL